MTALDKPFDSCNCPTTGHEVDCWEYGRRRQTNTVTVAVADDEVTWRRAVLAELEAIRLVLQDLRRRR